MNHNSRANGILLEESMVNAHQTRTEAPIDINAPFFAPTGDANLWVPIGPSTVLNGQASDRPRVAGRVNDIAVSPDGKRAYAATANGGVWFTGDEGNSWSPLGGWLPTPGAATINRAAGELTCGCLLVTFGAHVDGSDDDVYVGTGELIPSTQGTPGNQQGGVGVLHLSDNVQLALANPFGAHWKREAKNLAGYGIFRLARDPAHPDTLVAATSIGLFTRSGAFVEDADWTRVTAGPFNFGLGDGKRTTDVLWVGSRTFVALEAGSSTAVWTSPNGLAEPFTNVNLPHVLPGRLALAVAPGNASVVYVVGKGPRLWRLNDTTPTEITGLPDRLFVSTSDQSDYDMAIAVDPADEKVVVLGGATSKADGVWSANLFKFTIPAATAGFTPAFQADPAKDPSFIGSAVHADVHQVLFVKTASATHVWVCCDGGVFRSVNGGAKYTFLPRNTGLAVLETDYVASHPVNDAFVLAGAQDDGLLMRVGDTVWQYSDSIGGDAGGVVFHPKKTQYFAAQYNVSSWHSNGTLSPPVERGTSAKSEKNEDGNSSFYSGADIRKNAAGQGRLAIGTNRVWLADTWDPEAAPPTAWITLPSASDPRRNFGTDETTDTYGDGTGEIIVCRWAADNRLFALIQSGKAEGNDSAVLLYHQKPDGKWERKAVSEHSNKKSAFSNSDISQPTSDYLPPLGSWSDLAIHDPGNLPNGSVYVTTTGSVRRDGQNLVEADRMDTLWWYDGSSKWYPTGLRNSNTGTKAPAYAVVVDPSNANKVYVGTALGVWLGTLTPGAPPTWQWQIFSNGLPESAVEDLSFYTAGGVNILRAAVKSRGIWEVDVSASPGPTQRTFLRVHANDARRAATTALANPMKNGPTPDWPWNASPDIRLRPAPYLSAETIPKPSGTNALPWTGGTDDVYNLWVFQTALHATDPLCRPTGLWSNQFIARLAAQNTALGRAAGLANIIDTDRWDKTVNPANTFAPPWDGSEPTEADLYELIIEPPPDITSTPSPGPPPFPRVERRKYRVDVLVHFRDVRPVGALAVWVTLLRREIPADPAQWPPIAIAPAWKTAVEQILTANANPALGDGWTIADSGSHTRQPASPVDARTPRAVTFDVDFTANSVGQKFALLAVVHSTPDPVSAASLTGDTLQDLVLKCHQVAIRTVRVV
jgi:hypothetical protein